jgi:hypothetical protein
MNASIFFQKRGSIWTCTIKTAGSYILLYAMKGPRAGQTALYGVSTEVGGR